MDELLRFYEEIVKQAEDHQIIDHLTNLVKDAATLADATKSIIETAKARLTAGQQ